MLGLWRCARVSGTGSVAKRKRIWACCRVPCVVDCCPASPRAWCSRSDLPCSTLAIQRELDALAGLGAYLRRKTYGSRSRKRACFARTESFRSRWLARALRRLHGKMFGVHSKGATCTAHESLWRLASTLLGTSFSSFLAKLRFCLVCRTPPRQLTSGPSTMARIM